MKFLSRALDNSNLMIIRTYYNAGTRDFRTPDDVLDIVYKDMDTGKKYVETIKNPKIEIYIAKPEYRNYHHFKNFIPIEHCTKHLVSYKTRYADIGRVLGCSPREAKTSPYVYQIDMDIEHYYMLQFQIEYGNDLPKKLSLGFSDIESDIINTSDFGAPGECPPNAISYFDSNTMNMYTFVCVQDNIPKVDPIHKKYEYYEKLRSRFKEMTDDFIARVEEFKEECNREFEPSYGHIDYHVLIFEDEISMAKAYWQIVEYCDNDYLFFWNAPYDVSNLIERPKALGINPSTFIPSTEFGVRELKWYEDKNAKVQKRKHIFDTYTKASISDQMVNYAGIRSGGSKLPSVKLNAIAKDELGDEKLDYSEYGNIRMFPYYDFWKFILYNIKDVLLQYGIERKTHDASYIYTLISQNCLKTPEVFVSTTIVGNSLRLFAFKEEKCVMGSNAQKLFREPKSDDGEEKKKDKFSGAFVQYPQHAKSTGFELLGQASRYIHEFCIDYDIGSE